jgi:hypothetical protein
MTSVPLDETQHESPRPGEIAVAAIELAGDDLHPCQGFADIHTQYAAAADLAQAIRSAASVLDETDRAVFARYLYPEGGAL